MTTRDTIQGYFRSLKEKKGWEAFLADRMTFTSFTSPVKRVSGRTEFLESTKRFYSMVAGVEVRDLVVDGDKACALTRYELHPPGRSAFDSDVAEVFEVRDAKSGRSPSTSTARPFPSRRADERMPPAIEPWPGCSGGDLHAAEAGGLHGHL